MTSQTAVLQSTAPPPTAAVAPSAAVLPPGTLRLTGEAGCPIWRGRLHLAALVVSVPAGTMLLARRPTVPVALYSVSLIALFAVSAAYHLLPLPPLSRRRLRQADHATIYAFTAASMMPLCVYATGGTLGTAVAVAAWLSAAAGITIKVRGFDRTHGLGGAMYFVVGCMALGALPRAAHHFDALEVALTAGMALSYGAGASVLYSRRPDPLPEVFGYHEVWHAAVVLASACWYVVVWEMVGH